MAPEIQADDDAIGREVQAFGGPVGLLPAARSPTEPPSPPSADALVGAFRRWLELLVTWNRRLDLTAARSTEELTDLMLADALALSPHVPIGARVVDVGAGAGAPGLALAIARPDLQVSLVEPLAKRVSFLRSVVGALERTDVRLIRARGELLTRGSEKWDAAISRATLAPPAWLAMGKQLVVQRGSVWALLAKDEPPDDDEATIAVDFSYALPLTGIRRRAVRYVVRRP
jgi:16S rRNA (guanine527-N7)-methyltransferase